MANSFPTPLWSELKKELMEKWHQLTENEIERTGGSRSSLADLLERKVGLPLEEASEKIASLASRYHLYDEPAEEPQDIQNLEEEKHDKVLELMPKTPAGMDPKPKNPLV